VDIANSNVVNTIYKYLSNANRSEADKEMSTVATKVLINLAKYEKTAASIWQVIQHILQRLVPNYTLYQDEIKCPLLCIQEVLGLNLSLETGYPFRSLWLSCLQINAGTVPYTVS
jgi:hypothetical protein